MPTTIFRLTCCNCGTTADYQGSNRPMSWGGVSLEIKDRGSYVCAGLSAPELCPACLKAGENALRLALSTQRALHLGSSR